MYYPWYDENTDILGGYASFAGHYDIVKRIVGDNEQKYTAEKVDDMCIDEDSRPENAWCNKIAHCTEDSDTCVAGQGVKEQDLLRLIYNRKHCCRQLLPATMLL